jgi:hypothetical protein
MKTLARSFAIAVAALVTICIPLSAWGATIIVSNTNDSGPGSLREAITLANLTTAADTINFSIPTSDPGYNSLTGTWTIKPLSPLPQILYGTTIDGTTQPGFAGTPIIELDGSLAGSGSTGGVGLYFYHQSATDSSTVRGLAINRFRSLGIFMLFGSGHVIQGNFVGTDTSGTIALGNGATGVSLSGVSNTRVGGTTAAARNLLSGNSNGPGVSIGTDSRAPTAGGNVVEGNYIGTDITGTVALPNTFGVFLNSLNVRVGGTTAASRNIISGNSRDGVILYRNIPDEPATSGNVVQGNYIGLAVNGSLTLGNGGAGVNILADVANFPGVIDNTVGGTAAGAANIIAGNGQGGVIVASTEGPPYGATPSSETRFFQTRFWE